MRMYMHTHTGKAFSPPGLYAPHSHPPHRPPTPHICAQLWTHTIPSTRNWARARMYWLTCNTCTVSRAMCTVSRATHVLSHVQHMYWLMCNTCTVSRAMYTVSHAMSTVSRAICTVSRAMCTVSRATHVLSHVQFVLSHVQHTYCLTCNTLYIFLERSHTSWSSQSLSPPTTSSAHPTRLRTAADTVRPIPDGSLPALTCRQ